MASTGPVRIAWENKLRDLCSWLQLGEPIFEQASDRRGGRTAWSYSVKIRGEKYTSRFFYDHNYIHNAREDAAEVALLDLTSPKHPWAPTIYQGQVYGQGQNK